MNFQPIISPFDQEANHVRSSLPSRQAVVIIGSTSFWHKDSLNTCVLLGQKMATIKNLILVTGGVSGVGENVGQSFFNERQNMSGDLDLFHVLPHGYKPINYGVTLFAGADMYERREILARIASLYIVIEGGPGTDHEGNTAQKHGAVLIPVGRSGGYAGHLYHIMSRPESIPEVDWHLLGNDEASPEEVASAIYNIVRKMLLTC